MQMYVIARTFSTLLLMFIYNYNHYIVSLIAAGKNDKHKRCMFTTHTPERTECILTREFSEVFPDYVPRVQDRVMRIVENYESAEEELEEKENLEPAPKKMKIFYKKGATNDSGSDFNDLMHVFKTDEGILYACTLTKTDLQLNQNKFYKLKILKHDNHDAFWLLKEWGRTGTESGSERFNDEPTYDAMTKEKAIAAFERKFQELTGNFWKFPPYPEVEGKYVYLKTDYKEEESEQLIDDVLGYHNLDKPVEDLVKLMFSKEIINQTLMEMEIDAEKMPLGMLSKSNLDEAQQLLLEIENDLENGSPDDGRFTKNTKSFYHLIPHGSDIQKPLPIINSIDELYQKMQLIEDLRKIEVAFKFSDENLNPILENYHNLETEITSIDRECDEFEMIREYCKNTFAPKHSKYMFEIEEVFKIDCSIDKETFNQHKDSTNRMLLWHGSKIANFASILKNGLRVSPPSEVHQTGKMFGCGIYFADIVSKSVQYVDRYENNKQALLLLSEVALGDKFEVTKKLGRRFTKENLPEGKTSIKAIGKTSPNVCEEIENGLKVPLGYLETDNEFLSDVQFNEYVVFDESRIKMRFLVRIRFGDAGSD
jgi:poly [ADP-ribose] polymerase